MLYWLFPELKEMQRMKQRHKEMLEEHRQRTMQVRRILIDEMIRRLDIVLNNYNPKKKSKANWKKEGF